MLLEGLAELGGLLDTANLRRPGAIIADLKIARGLDYYTGTVYESFMAGHEDLGSVCSGGRYDSLATNGRRTFPGVGISIGLSRLLARVIGEGLVEVSRSVPTAVLVAVTDEAHRSASDAIADALRARGVSADVAPSAAKFGKQIRAADKRSIPFVWFPGADGAPDSVKDIRTGEQVEADAVTPDPRGAATVPLEEVARRCFERLALTEPEARGLRHGQPLDAAVLERAEAPEGRLGEVASKGISRQRVVAGFAPSGRLVALLRHQGPRARPVLVLDPA